MISAVFQSIGPTELLIVLGIVLLIFGPKRLPQLGRQLGGGMREFKDSITGKSKADEEFGDEAGDEAGRAKAQAALGRAEASTAAAAEPVTGDVVPETKP
jgi:sec-independent protein translocase protein TatA